MASEYDPRFLERRVSTDLVTLVKFDNGTITDRSVYNRSGTLSGDAAVVAGTRYLSLDGTGDYLNFADAPELNMAGDMSVSLWVKRNGNPAATELMSAKYAAVAGWLFLISNDGKVHFDGRTSGGSYASGPVTVASICNNAWRHVVIARSGSNWILYLDGASVGSVANGAHTFANTRELSLGVYNAGAGYVSPLTGTLADFRFYSRALSAAEIATIYSQGCP